MQLILRLIETNAKCQHTIGLDSAGVPVKCGKNGFARLENGVPLCHKHLEEKMDSIEVRDANEA
jgi:hypothetical protein